MVDVRIWLDEVDHSSHDHRCHPALPMARKVSQSSGASGALKDKVAKGWRGFRE